MDDFASVIRSHLYPPFSQLLSPEVCFLLLVYLEKPVLTSYILMIFHQLPEIIRMYEVRTRTTKGKNATEVPSSPCFYNVPNECLGEVMLDRRARGSTAGRDAQFIEDGSDMRVDRRQAHPQSLGDLGIGQPGGQPT
jgi:hypothetical protein